MFSLLNKAYSVLRDKKKRTAYNHELMAEIFQAQVVDPAKSRFSRYGYSSDISDDEWETGQVQRAVREHVPESALRGGPDGLDFVRPLIAGAGPLLNPAGLLALEIAHARRDAVLDLAAATPDLRDARVLKDHEGLWRVFLARRA